MNAAVVAATRAGNSAYAIVLNVDSVRKYAEI